jgi:hypothetical protein
VGLHGLWEIALADDSGQMTGYPEVIRDPLPRVTQLLWIQRLR